MKNIKFPLAALMAGLVVAAHAAAPKYVFLFIGDGMSTPQRMVAQEFAEASGHGKLAMNLLPYQSTTRTRAANAIITDSAAAATAIACGEKTNNGMLGVTPDGTRLESVAEVAHKAGRRVGIMTTVTIVHATPAGFYAHRTSRGRSYQIALDLIDSGFEFFAGGGVYNKFDDRTDSEYKGNVFWLAEKAGIRLARDKATFEAFANQPGARYWGVFGDDALPFAIDGYGDAPSLADMTKKAIEVLDNDKGFFMMCEGGKVDYAGHANDAATSLREVLAMDEAVKVAVAFQERHPADTLIITTGDHETGGLSMGFAGTGGKFYVELLAHQKVSAEVFNQRIRALLNERPDVPFEEVMPMVTEGFGLIFEKTPETLKNPLRLHQPEIADLRQCFESDRAAVKAGKSETRAHDVRRKYLFAAACKRILAAHAGVGWSSGAHTALPTLTTAKGPGAENFIGMLENCDIARKLKAMY